MSDSFTNQFIAVKFNRIGVLMVDVIPKCPDSPEMRESIRYFTYSFDQSGKGEKVAFFVNAFTEREAEELCRSLLGGSTGWVKTTYRYRVYENRGLTYVTVIDQGRELLPSYRTLIISAVGVVVGLAVSIVFLILVGRRLFRPLEEADRKQRKFISDAESEFKVPLTIINADAELIEREKGPDDYTRSIHKQVKKMTELVKDLGKFAILEEGEENKKVTDISAAVETIIEENKLKFSEKGLELSAGVEKGISLELDGDAFYSVVAELMENAYKFAISYAHAELKRDQGHVALTVVNDAALPETGAETVFDRFSRLSNAEGIPGNGLGLSYVKDAVKAMGGRAAVEINENIFTMRVIL